MTPPLPRPTHPASYDSVEAAMAADEEDERVYDEMASLIAKPARLYDGEGHHCNDAGPKQNKPDQNSE